MKREPNLFEAFQTSKPKLKPQEAEPVQPVWTGEKGGSAALASPTRLGLAFGAAIVLAFTAGYFVGRPGADTVHAGAGDDAGASSSPLGESAEVPWYVNDTAGNGGAPSGGESGPGDPNFDGSQASGLYNPDNLYTVLAITYSDVPSNQGQAKKITDYLRGKGLPAFEPISRAGRIEILVGASATSGALQEVTSKLRTTAGPSGKTFDFKSAYVVQIDDHVDRP